MSAFHYSQLPIRLCGLLVATPLLPLATAEAAIMVVGQSNPGASTWESGVINQTNVSLGSNDVGSLKVDLGSTLTISGDNGTFFGTGGSSNGNATVTITDPSTQLTINSNNVFVLGNTTGVGTMFVQNGAGFTTNQDANIGNNGPTARGDLTIDGFGSQWNAREIAVGREGTGTLSVLNRAQVTANVVAIGRDGGTGSLTVTGNGSSAPSTVTVNRRQDNSGGGFAVTQESSLRVSNGGRINAASEVVLSGADMVVEGSGTQISSGGNFGVSSENGQAQLIVQDGARVQVGSSGNGANTTVGFTNGSGGELTVQGSGTTFNSTGDFVVGNGGDGVLNILDGGRVNNDRVFRLSGQGEVNIRGAGSRLVSGNPNDQGQMDISDGGVLNVLNGGQVTIGQEVNVLEGATVNLFVDGNNVVRTGTNNDDLGYVNRGTTNLFAPAELAAGDYTPIESSDPDAIITNTGTINAIGGTFDTDTGIFSVSDITTDPQGELGGLRVQYEENMVVSFADSVGDIDFSVSNLNINFIEGEFILAGYMFDTTLQDIPTGITFIVQEEFEFEDLTFWYLADGETEWTEVDPNQTQIEGVNASLLVSEFSGYAVTHATFIPEPSSAALLMGAAGLLALRRRRRS